MWLNTQVLDLSFNSIGAVHREEGAVDALSAMFAANTALTHLDVSHTNLREDDMETLETGLNENHTLLGLHTAGKERAAHVAQYKRGRTGVLMCQGVFQTVPNHTPHQAIRSSWTAAAS